MPDYALLRDHFEKVSRGETLRLVHVLEDGSKICTSILPPLYLGINPQYETVIFYPNKNNELCARYGSEEAAQAGHNSWVQYYKDNPVNYKDKLLTASGENNDAG